MFSLLGTVKKKIKIKIKNIYIDKYKINKYKIKKNKKNYK